MNFIIEIKWQHVPLAIELHTPFLTSNRYPVLQNPRLFACPVPTPMPFQPKLVNPFGVSSNFYK